VLFIVVGAFACFLSIGPLLASLAKLFCGMIIETYEEIIETWKDDEHQRNENNG
jgi:hypothetical protein